MVIDILKLKNGIESEVIIDDNVSFDSSYLVGTDLLDLKSVSVNGDLSFDSMDDIFLNLSVSGVMVLECAVTLVPVDYPFNFQISGKICDFLEDFNKNIQNSIDILPIIWENILMEIPMRVVSPDAKIDTLQGDGWRFVTEGEHNNVNPELEKLKDLL